MCNYCTILLYDLTHSCTPNYKSCCFQVFLLSFLFKDIEQAKSQQVQWAKWLFFESHLMVLWQDVKIIQNLYAAGLTAVYFTNFFSLLFSLHHCCEHSQIESKKAGQCRKGPLCSFTWRCVSSPVSIRARCFKVRLSGGMLSALIYYPGHALSQLECRMCFSGLQEDCVNTAGFMIQLSS